MAATISCEATCVDGIFCTLWDSGTCPRILGLPNIQSFTGNPDLEKQLGGSILLSELRLLGLLEISQLQASWAVHAKRVQGGCGTAWAAQNGQN